MPFDLCEMGRLLKEAREERGLTFEEVSEALFIRKRVIGAIEAGDWSNLPHPVYVKGYVTQYASFLKIADFFERVSPAKEDDSQAPGTQGSKKKEFSANGGQGRRDSPVAL
jgi:cytoskeleton protein RodZ